ncbi:DUF3987 domain-containing protein [Herbaspirillum lusitanum]|uniref:DUF3987 domain-containing protein n=1 Tax=Herbaspirillum lusitanum TaxID=213312 RepID=UPI0003029734|nr:DUF3987 domain-containing protein [Herbaspirillum lusitanum]
MTTPLAPVASLSRTPRHFVEEHSWSDVADRLMTAHVSDCATHLTGACFKVEIPKGKMPRPLNTNSFIVAPAGSGKTDAGELILRCYDDLVQEHQQSRSEMLGSYQDNLIAWQARQSGLNKRIKDIESQDGLSDKERNARLEDVEQRRQQLLKEKPVEPATAPCRASDFSFAGIKKGVAKHLNLWIKPDEGFSVLSHLEERGVAIINGGHSGQLYKSLMAAGNGNPVIPIFTVSIAIQPKPFDQFRDSKIGALCLGSGFFDRCGFAYVDNEDVARARKFETTGPGPATEAYLSVMRYFFAEAIKQGEKGYDTRPVLKVSRRAIPVAERAERCIKAVVEDYAPFFDDLTYPARAYERVIRMAAVDHAFEGAEGDITGEEIENALERVIWHIDNFRLLFDRTEKSYLHLEDADRIAELLFMRGRNRPFPISQMKSMELELSLSNLRLRNGIACLINEGRLKQIEKSGGVYFKLR